MTTILAVVASFTLGWLAHKWAYIYGMRIVGRDPKERRKLLDGLGYEALIKLRAATDEELSRRKP